MRGLGKTGVHQVKMLEWEGGPAGETHPPGIVMPRQLRHSYAVTEIKSNRAVAEMEGESDLK
jgi:hypothetical protein